MSASQLFNAVKAEQLLAGSDLLKQIEDFRTELRYTTDGDVFSYDDYYSILQKQITALPHLTLQSEIAPNTENEYQVKLLTALDDIYTAIERISIKLAHFQSKIKTAESRADSLKASFVAWYCLALDDYLTAYDKKLTATTVANLASSEFERLMQGVNVDLSNLGAALKVQVEILNKRKKTAQDKFNLGKDQANASWTGRVLPSDRGIVSDPSSRDLLEIQDEDQDEVPAFVSKQPQIGTETQGFFKVGDAQPVTLLPDELVVCGPHKCPVRPEGAPCPFCHPESIPEGKTLVGLLAEFAMAQVAGGTPHRFIPKKVQP